MLSLFCRGAFKRIAISYRRFTKQMALLLVNIKDNFNQSYFKRQGTRVLAPTLSFTTQEK